MKKINYIDIQIFSTIGALSAIITVLTAPIANRTPIEHMMSFFVLNIFFSFVVIFGLHEEKHHYAGVAWLLLDLIFAILLLILFLGSCINWNLIV